MMTMSFVRSIVWFVLILLIGFAATIIVANEVVRANLKPIKPILIRDKIGVGSHILSGVVPVPSSCDEVIVYTEKISDSLYSIIFSTWREPYIHTCLEGEASREFRAVVFASSSGTSFVATLNGEPVPIAVIPEIPLRGMR